MSAFSETMIEDKARNRMVHDIQLIDSEWPAHTPTGIASASGWVTPASQSAGLLLSLPSAKWFKPRTIIVDNQNTVQNHLTFYEGGSASACSGYLFAMWIDPKSTAFIALDGITAGASIYVQAELCGSTTIKIGGLLIASMAEN